MKALPPIFADTGEYNAEALEALAMLSELPSNRNGTYQMSRLEKATHVAIQGAVASAETQGFISALAEQSKVSAHVIRAAARHHRQIFEAAVILNAVADVADKEIGDLNDWDTNQVAALNNIIANQFAGRAKDRVYEVLGLEKTAETVTECEPA